MYEIRPETAKTFITDYNVVLPRFQRKQTWDDKKNFQLCISVFKNYPLGVCILHLENKKSDSKKYLLDGRQRRNALSLMYENPEEICKWAKKFIGYKKNADIIELQDLFKEKIHNYLEMDDSDYIDDQTSQYVDSDSVEESDTDTEDAYPIINSSLNDSNGIDLLLNILKIIYIEHKHDTGFTNPFNFYDYISNLPYVDCDSSNSYVLNGKKVKSFINEYYTDCKNNSIDEFESYDSFVNYVLTRGQLKNNITKDKFKQIVSTKWNDIVERMLIVKKIDDMLSTCKIGLIEVRDVNSTDSQKIFNIINSEGVKLTAVEILSAKGHWNKKITNPTQEMINTTKEMYKNMGMNVSDVYRWDIPATLLERLDKNIVFKTLSWDSNGKKAEFEKKLTLGFKIFAGIYENGITKDNIDHLGEINIDWGIDSEKMIKDINTILKLISQSSYFNFLKTWNISIVEITSDAVALDFILEMYFDWINKGQQIGNNVQTKKFVKNSFILWDRLVYEYVTKQWRGSSDSKIATNIKRIKDDKPDIFVPVATDKWKELFDEIQNNSTIGDNDIKLGLMKPIIYHMYCLNNISGPDPSLSYDIDHILPQSAFKTSMINRKDIVQDNLFNLALLPKKENIQKSDSRLITIDDEWLKSQISIYEFIPSNKYKEFSDIQNYQKLFKYRRKKFDNAFITERDKILNN